MVKNLQSTSVDGSEFEGQNVGLLKITSGVMKTVGTWRNRVPRHDRKV